MWKCTDCGQKGIRDEVDELSYNAVIFSDNVPPVYKNTKNGSELHNLVVEYACSEKGRQITDVPKFSEKY